MKDKADLTSIIEKIASDKSPVGMDAVYVHALILDKLDRIEARLAALEGANGGKEGAEEASVAPDASQSNKFSGNI